MKTLVRFSVLTFVALGLFSCAPTRPVALATVEPTAVEPSPTPASYPSPLEGRAVLTYYFYWYDARTGAHLAPYGQVPGLSLTDHPAGRTAPNWRRPAWHLEQLKDAVEARIDALLPVYWPGDLDWANGGLGALAKALELLRHSGTTPPAVGMFFDTTPLRGMDLRTIEARDYVYEGIHYFFSTIPRQYWAMVDGNRPVIWFYSGNFPTDYDKRFFNDIHSRFEQDFGLRPFLVMDEDWNCQRLPNQGDGFCDATYAWGGAISPAFSPQVAAIGPGYDERGLPDRTKALHVDRRNGTTYENGLVKAMKCGQPWLAIETWNEYHEGTEIADSLEYGRQYIELTRQIAGIFKSGLLPLDQRIETAYTDARSVAFLAGSTSQHGLTLVPDTGEGTYGSAIIDGKHAVTSEKPATDAHAYRLSFQVDDGFYFAQKRSVVLRVDYFDEGKDPIMLEYDGAPCRDNSGEAGFRQVLLAEREGSNTWRTAELALDEATFASQGSTPDFRLVTEKTALAVHLVRVADATP